MVLFRRGDDLHVDLGHGTVPVARDRPDLRAPVLARSVSPDRLAVAWLEGPRVYLSTFESADGFTAPRLVTDSATGPMRLAMQAGYGDALVAWAKAGRLLYRVDAPGGARGEVETLRDEGGPVQRLKADATEEVYRQPGWTVAWSDTTGLFARTSTPEGFGPVAALSDEQPDGLALHGPRIGWGDSKNVHAALVPSCPPAPYSPPPVVPTYSPRTGPAHVVDINGAGEFLYTRGRRIFTAYGPGDERRVGRGRKARLEGSWVYYVADGWARGAFGDPESRGDNPLAYGWSCPS